jgi:multidrug resistance efflux pump
VRTVVGGFEQSGTVTSVDVKVGDTVRAGQNLAQIDAGDLRLALQQAQANLKAAQASYDKLKTGSATEPDIASAQAQLDAAKAQFDALQNPSAADLSAAQSKVAQAQTSVQSTQNSASQAKTNAQLALQNAVNALTSRSPNIRSPSRAGSTFRTLAPTRSTRPPPTPMAKRRRIS